VQQLAVTARDAVVAPVVARETNEGDTRIMLRRIGHTQARYWSVSKRRSLYGGCRIGSGDVEGIRCRCRGFRVNGRRETKSPTQGKGNTTTSSRAGRGYFTFGTARYSSKTTTTAGTNFFGGTKHPMGSLGRRIGSWYETMSLRRPWSTAFVTCAIKGMAADLLIQIAVEGKEWKGNDWKRTLVFSSYGAFYCGWWQHFLYNIAYRRLFGPSTALFNAARTVLFDSVLHVPFVIFPVYYVYKALLLGGSHGETAVEGLRLYAEEAITINMRYYSVWVPANMLVFTIVPVPFRIGFIATTSFVWLSLVSFMTLRRTGPVVVSSTNGPQRLSDDDEKNTRVDTEIERGAA